MRRHGVLSLAALAALLLALALAAQASAAIGTRGASYSEPGRTATAPTGEKPQSKTWFEDGTWWAVMYNPGSGSFEIFKRALDGTWSTTGTLVDARDGSWQDVLWDGNHLQVVSAGNKAASTGSAVRYPRFGYDSVNKRWVDEIPQTALTSYGVEVAVLDRDSTGKLWVTFTHDSEVWVTHTLDDQATWSDPFVIPVLGADSISADDISSIVSFNGRIGVMWSDQVPNGTGNDVFRWATHVDGQPDSAWQVSTVLSGVELADDHINLKAIDNDPAGQVFAAVKTSLNRAADPQILVLWLDNTGTWHSTTGLRVQDGTPTRAQVAIDKGRRELYLFAAEGPCCTGGAIFMKKTSLDGIAFATGPGTPILQSSTDKKINNVSTPKEPVDATSDLPILASDDSVHRYWQTLIPLDGTDISPPETTINSGPAATTSSTSATLTFSANEASSFSCSVDGSPFTACNSPVTLGGLAPGSHTFQAQATDLAGNTDPTPATRNWTVTATGALFADGFESGDFSAWTSVLSGVDGTTSVVGSPVAVGSFAARLSSTATKGSFAYARKTLAQAATSLTVDGEFRIDAEGAAGGNVPLLRLYTPDGARMISLYRPNGSTKLYVSHSGANFATTGRLPAATYERVAVDIVAAGAGASTVTVRVEGVQVYSTTTASLDPSGVSTIQIGNDTKSQAFVVLADDLEVR